MEIQTKLITEIHPYEKNPRFNDNAVETVAKSIKEFGFQQPIVVDKDYVIIVGHTRLKAAERLGLTEVPVVVADNLTPEQVQAYRIADNKTGEIAEWNYDLLPLEIKDLQEANFDISGAVNPRLNEQQATKVIGKVAKAGEGRFDDSVSELIKKVYTKLEDYGKSVNTIMQRNVYLENFHPKGVPYEVSKITGRPKDRFVPGYYSSNRKAKLLETLSLIPELPGF